MNEFKSLTVLQTLKNACAHFDEPNSYLGIPIGIKLVKSAVAFLEIGGKLNDPFYNVPNGDEVKIKEKSKTGIKSIMRGWGEGATLFQTQNSISTSTYVDSIDKYWEITGNQPQEQKLAYVGTLNGSRVFTMFPGPDITITYW